MCVAIVSLVAVVSCAAEPEPLAGTGALTMQGDIASQMVEGVDRFLMKQIASSESHRGWGIRLRVNGLPGIGDLQEPAQPMDERRKRLACILGVRDERPAKVEMGLVATTDHAALVGKSPAFDAFAVRWRAFGDVHGEGLLLVPVGKEPLADVIAIPDADQTPEMICGLEDGVGARQQYGRRLAEMGYRVIVPALIDRHVEARHAPGRSGGVELSNREFIYRSAFELGRHIIGYEVEKILAAIDWFKAQDQNRPIGVFGWGEGGMLALYSAAIDPRINASVVSGYFGEREAVWKEPIERNVFGLLRDFGDAELKVMADANRKSKLATTIEICKGPRFTSTGKGAAPGELTEPVLPQSEHKRASHISGLMVSHDTSLIRCDSKDDPGPGSDEALIEFSRRLMGNMTGLDLAQATKVTTLYKQFDPAARQARQLHELDRHNQQLQAKSAEVRREFMKKLDTSSIEKYEASAKPYRESLYNDVLGRCEEDLLPMNARTRKIYHTEKYTGYEVVLDVFPDVIAYGTLLLPKDLKEGEKRPVVVCQHGLEGRPKDTIEGDSPYYHAFAAKLAERGFITFSPQNLYIFGDRFRVFSRKANPLGKTIWSIIIPQHQQILNFLKTLPNVDGKRIAFYGLSYGGKTAMRVPAVLTDYCLSICSGDFNEWVFKNASTTNAMSYVFTNEYEIFEWDLGSTFNYYEMAALIAPRPFMVERGHFDGVSTDEYVAFEFAKVRRLYNGMLKIGDRCEIEFFAGPHMINGKGTFDFLHKHLNWEKR